jgi:hypothetical protein
MRTFLRTLGAIVFLALLFLAGSLGYSTARGYTRWYFRVDGQVVVDGRSTTGYLHANTEKTLLMLTRTDDSRPETYLVSLERDTKTGVLDCGEFHAPRFLPFPVGHLNSPCSFIIGDPVKFHDAPIAATLTTGRNFIEFSTASGKKVRGQW